MTNESYSVLDANGKPRCTHLPIAFAERAMLALISLSQVPVVVAYLNGQEECRVSGACSGDEVIAVVETLRGLGSARFATMKGEQQ